MEVRIDSGQMKRIGFDLLDKIYGPLRKYWGETFTEVFIDSEWKPRIGYYNSILRPKAIYILKDDFTKFKNVMPLSESQFGEIFASWLSRNYSIENIDQMTTTTSDMMMFKTPSKNPRTTSY